ncbi:fimbrial protein [Pseudomonas tolaasii]|uniref:fimbrial protein n=1 Tax=Pseudomonas tolaasii TaxID=29442 RepID=UPI001C56F507|nr:fimbrial protein [Pseudomonas tolaasii]MBW1250807.1 fimbrial protein [Pseudomonas tolaasii]
MNKKIIAAAVLATSAFASLANAADGTINFTGTVLATACTVNAASSTTQNVPMGNVAPSAFRAAGDTTLGGPISIVLSSCPAAVTSAVIKFDGTANATNSSLLALTNTSGVATGLGIGIYESNGTTMIPVGTSSASKTLSTTAPTTFSFVTKYVATAATVTNGPANAVSNFTVSYN